MLNPTYIIFVIGLVSIFRGERHAFDLFPTLPINVLFTMNTDIDHSSLIFSDEIPGSTNWKESNISNRSSIEQHASHLYLAGLNQRTESNIAPADSISKSVLLTDRCPPHSQSRAFRLL